MLLLLVVELSEKVTLGQFPIKTLLAKQNTSRNYFNSFKSNILVLEATFDFPKTLPNGPLFVVFLECL